MDTMQLAAETVTRSIEIITTDVETKLKKYLEKCVYLVLQLYESTDTSDTSQLAVIVKMFFDNFFTKEEFLKILPLRGRRRGNDIFNFQKIYERK